MIETQKATVYFSSKRNRRYFSKQSAINAEARAIIFQRYPIDDDYNILIDDTEKYSRLFKSLVYKIKKNC